MVCRFSACVEVQISFEHAVIGFDGEIIDGIFPKKQLHMVQAWVAIHEDELQADWLLLSEGQQSFRLVDVCKYVCR